MQVTLQYPAENLAELVSVADNGEDVEIARPQKPALKLVVSAGVSRSEASGRRILGALRGQIAVPSEGNGRRLDDELSDLASNGSIFPPE